MPKKRLNIKLPNCPECVARERKKIIAKYADAEEEVDLTKFFDEIEFPMKLDISTKHFMCKRCGLYATREQVSDIREKIGRRERTREDHQYDYLSWWNKSKTEKAKN